MLVVCTLLQYMGEMALKKTLSTTPLQSYDVSNQQPQYLTVLPGTPVFTVAKRICQIKSRAIRYLVFNVAEIGKFS